MSPSVLVTGSSGFVGTALLSALCSQPRWQRLRLLVHRDTPDLATGENVEHIRADLADAGSMQGLCDGVDTVLHLASHLTEDAGLCQKINAEGTEALVRIAQRAGVKRFVYLSNAAVYGFAEHRNAAEDQLEPSPATPISRSRVAAERTVLDAGGTVLRPLFVYGPGDTRFVPVIFRALRKLPFMINGGRAQLSVVSVHDLAQAITDLTFMPSDAPCQGVFHVTDGFPISFRELASNLARSLEFRLPPMSLPYPMARWILRMLGGHTLGSRKWSITAEHRLFLVSHDHSYDSSRIWHLLGSHPEKSFGQRIDDYTDWYVPFLADRAAVATGS
jgi:nucleoside-diphosphate-sugar epimerase